MSKYNLSRRTMLRGMAGGSSIFVGLPLLEAMLNSNGEALADGSDLPLRFMTWYWGDGIVIGRWEPDAVGPTWQLSEQLAPLANVKDYVSVLSGLQNRCDESQLLTHHEGMTGFTGYSIVADPQELNSDPGGPSIDQRIADLLAGCTPVRDVHVRVSKRISTDGDGGPNAHAMSHRGEPGSLTTNFPQESPRDVWDHLFGEFADSPTDGPLRLSILDYVKEDVDRLRPSLGMQDRARLDAHLQGVDELAAKISADPVSCRLPAEPTEENQDDAQGNEPISAVNTAMAELIAYAFSCDLTRVASFMFKRFVSSTEFSEINPDRAHHAASHRGAGNATYQAGITFQMQKFADLLEIFQATTDAKGDNLLDSTIIYATSDCSTGVSHTVARQPVLLAGRGNGHLVHPGIHYQTAPWNGANGQPNGEGNMSDVLLSCLRAFDPDARDVGQQGDAPYSDTPLSDVLA